MPKPRKHNKPTESKLSDAQTAPREEVSTEELDLLPSQALHEWLARVNGTTVPAATPAESRGANLYAFSVGDSPTLGVRVVIRVRADSRDEALARARRLAYLYFDGRDLLPGGDFQRYPWIDSLRIYSNGSPLSLESRWMEAW